MSTSLLFLTAAAFAQAPISFEVASIKKAEPLSVNMAMSGKMNLGMVIDNAQVSVRSMSLAELMRVAYKVKPFQISGPEWLTAERYTITAKMPAGSTRDQVPEMLQSLLADRFKLVLHRETKDQSVYALTVMKSGLKLQESPPDELASASVPGGAAAPLAPTPDNGGAQVRAEVTSDTSGTVNTSSINGSIKMMPRENGMHIVVTRMNASGMVDLLSRFVERPVVDMTDLKSRYDFTLDVGFGDMLALARAAGMNIPIQAPPGAMDPGNSAIFTAIQQYGLKLEPRKAPIEMLIIDHVEKTPTDN
ncbi:MAG TPA: TIGR03435 family protein [Bryobacteraceae bacterium]|nr:TIGR03435 family protein [Bryobacteraceae bacterium]